MLEHSPALVARQRSRKGRYIGLAGVLLLAGCGGGSPSEPEGEAPVASVVVNPDTATLVPGQTRQLSATARNAAGATLLGRAISWTANPEAVAGVSNAGLVTAASAGSAQINATSEGRTGSAAITVLPGGMVPTGGGTISIDAGAAAVVVPAGAITSPRAVSIQAVASPPAHASLVPGTAYDFGPSGSTFSQPVTLRIRYTEAAATGRVPARFQVHRYSGTAWVPVPGGSVDEVTRIVSAPTSSFSIYALIETPPPAPSVTVAPTTLNLQVGGSGPLTATVANPPGGVSTVTWTSRAPGVASLTGNGNTITVQGVAPGTTYVVARSTADPAAADSALVTVTPATQLVTSWTFDPQVAPRTDFLGLWGDSPTNVYGAATGAVYRFDGSTWTQTGSIMSARAIWGSGPTDVFIAGLNGVVERFNGVTWTPTSTGLPGITLHGLWGSGPTDVYAVGDNGSIARFNGTTWSVVSTGNINTPEYRGVWGSGASDVFVVGESGWASRFNGVSWTPLASGTAKHLYAVWGSGPTNVYAVGQHGTIRRFDGANWANVSHPLEGQTLVHFVAITGTSASNIYVTSSRGHVLRYNGTTWQLIDNNRIGGLLSAWADPGGTVFLGGYGGFTARGMGTDFTVLTQARPNFAGIEFDGSGTAYSMGSIPGQQLIFLAETLGPPASMSRFAGSGWETPIYPDRRVGGLNTLWGPDFSNLFLGGSGNGGSMFQPNGAAWSPIALEIAAGCENVLINRIWGADANNQFAVGRFLGGLMCDKALYRYDGVSWTRIFLGGSFGLTAVMGSSASNVFATAEDGSIHRFDGNAWTTSHTGIPLLYDVWVVGPSLAFAVGNSGTILRWDGATWTQQTSGTTERLRGVWAAGPNDVYAVGHSGTILHYNGTSWSPMVSGTTADFTGIRGSPGGPVFVVGNNAGSARGLILRGLGPAASAP